MEHIDKQRLLLAARHQSQLSADERFHVRYCEDCSDLFGVFCRRELYAQIEQEEGYEVAAA